MWEDGWLAGWVCGGREGHTHVFCCSSLFVGANTLMISSNRFFALLESWFFASCRSSRFLCLVTQKIVLYSLLVVRFTREGIALQI
jgi:hypothetical protein